MDRLLFIARFEYLRHLRRRAFLLVTFGVPLLVIAGFGLLFAVLFNERVERAIGYVDQAGVVRAGAAPLQVEGDDPPVVPLRPYPNEAAARAAFVAGEVDAYMILPPDYLSTGAAAAYGREGISREGTRSLRALLQASLVTGASSQAAQRAAVPLANLTLSTLDGSRVISSRQGFWLFLLPFLFGLLFVTATFSSSSHLLQAVIDEKENRTMEIVVTSVSPWQLIGGKTLGLGALGLTQALVWLVCGGALALLGGIFFEPLRAVSIPGDIALIALLVFIPGYLLYAGLMVGIGAMVTSMQEGQQLASLISLLGALPYMLNFVIISNPNGALAVTLSLFPLSAPLALVMRLPLTQVPSWQIGLSLLLLVLSSALAIRGAAAVFRIGMLRYGKSIRLRELARWTIDH